MFHGYHISCVLLSVKPFLQLCILIDVVPDNKCVCVCVGGLQKGIYAIVLNLKSPIRFFIFLLSWLSDCY